jgi:hypothetical protein
MAVNEITYETIDRPYNAYMTRDAIDTVDRPSLVESDNSDDGAAVKTGEGLSELWVENWIKSMNYKPKTQGFYFDAKTGYIEAMELYIGTIGGVIGGWEISSDAIYHDGETDATSSGMAFADYPFYAGKKYVDRATAPYRVTPAGIMYATGAVIDGTSTIGGITGTAIAYGATATADSVPAGLTVSSTGISTGSDGSQSAYVVLTWDTISSNIFDHYVIRFKKDALTYYTYLPSNINTITIEGLTPNILYNFGISSVNKYGIQSAFSANVSQITASDTGAPATVTSGTATGGIQYNIIEWTHNTDSDLASYNIYRNTTNDSGTATLIGNCRTNYFVDGGRTGGQIYYYWIKAVDTSGNVSSSFSTVMSSTPRNVQTTDVEVISAQKILLNGEIYISNWQHGSDLSKFDGANLFTGSVTTTALNFTPVQSTDVIASINASAEGIKIEADNITVSGSATFEAGWAAALNAESDINGSNIINGEGWTDDTVANAAQSAANAAQASANTALSELDDIAADDKLTPVEKLAAKKIWDEVVVEGTATTGTIPVQAIAFGVVDTDFDTAYAALYLYLNTTITAFANMAATTDIVRATWNTKWNDYYNQRTLLLNAIATKAKDLADTAQGTADNAQVDANTANAAIADIASDNILSQVEKPSIIQNNTVILAEQTGIDVQATTYGITTEKTAYDNAVTALTAYLATLTTPVLWSNLTGDTTIVGTTFRGKFADVYTTRQALLDAIASKIDTDKLDLLGGSYNSDTGSVGHVARVRIFPDINTGIQVIDDEGNDVFKALVGGTNVGDITFGNYAGGQGFFYDKSANTTTYAGALAAVSGSLGTIVLASDGYIRMGQTDYLTGNGFYLGIGTVNTGATNPGTAVNTDAGGGIATDPWSFTSDSLISSNDVYASCEIGNFEDSDYLDLTTFGYAIPTGATIVGVKVEVEKYASAADRIKDLVVQLIIGGTAVGDNNGDLSTFWGTTDDDTYVTYGGVSDMWGNSITPAQANASTFGVRIQVQNASGTNTAYIDHVRVTVYYTVAVASFGNSESDYIAYDGYNLDVFNLRRHDTEWLTLFESIDGYIVGGVGTEVVNVTTSGNLLMQTSAATNDTAYIIKDVPAGSFGLSWSKKRTWRTSFSIQNQMNQTIRFGTGGQVSAATNKQIGFLISNWTLYGVCADDTDYSTVSYGTISADTVYDVEARYNGSNSCEFFLNGTSFGAIKTHLPSGAGTDVGKVFAAYLKTDENNVAEITFNYCKFWQAA